MYVCMYVCNMMYVRDVSVSCITYNMMYVCVCVCLCVLESQNCMYFKGKSMHAYVLVWGHVCVVYMDMHVI